jgi:hypothetical protein
MTIAVRLSPTILRSSSNLVMSANGKGSGNAAALPAVMSGNEAERARLLDKDIAEEKV